MLYTVYVIYSEKFDQFYHGMSDNIDFRLKSHNQGKVRSTKAFTPWKLIYSEQFVDLSSARKRELYFKSSSGRRFLSVIKDRSRVPRPNAASMD
jgi:putative endonuclease